MINYNVIYANCRRINSNVQRAFKFSMRFERQQIYENYSLRANHPTIIQQ